MRKKIMLTLMILCFMCIPSVAAYAAEEDVILNDASGIPDKALYQAVLDALHKKAGDTFTEQEAGSLYQLWAPNGGVLDLTGISCLSNLKILAIRDNWNQKENEIRSLKPLQELKNLEELDIDHNSVLTSLEGIENLTQLKKLLVTRTGLASLTGIENLTCLNYLKVNNNSLASLNGIENLVQLEMLYAYDNRLTDVGSLKNLSNLKILHLGNNRIENIKGVEHLTNLEELQLNDNRLKSINEVKNLKKLDCLNVDHNELKKIPNLKNLRIKGDSAGLHLKGNHLTEKELKSKLKVHLKKKKFNTAWLKDQIAFQNNYKLVLASPKNVKNITRNTTKITGRIKKSGTYNKAVYVAVNDDYGRNMNKRARVNKQGELLRGQKGRKNTLVKTDKKGNFVIDKKLLRSVLKKGGDLSIDIYLYSEERRNPDVVTSIPLTNV